ncbi:nuclear transport factor 2 family protein [uncultured Chryseobacterium sp.]|uniref:nuclear transport factor 2 family protein n=1 Tax=uncultured Chryseobacterium sp. TaxID=259322 RepID=UPI0025FEC6EE|nr:nuclear transport factor 2 family protein [uncultured Chryseobacterium sp.]
MNNKEILQTANECIVKEDYEGFLDYCTEDIEWIFVGDRTLKGKNEVREYMHEVYFEPPVFNTEILIEEGDFVSVMGEISLKNQSGTYDHFSYCDNWRFENGKMAVLKAYVIKTESLPQNNEKEGRKL